MKKEAKSNLRFVCAFLIVCPFLVSPGSLWSQEASDLFVKEYRVGAKDLLEIKVFELPELSQTVRVSEDGSISLPLIGRIEVQGLTKDGVEEKLAGLLEAKYLTNAQVSVFIKEYESQQVAIIGAVEKPGTYELVGRTSLLQVISQAGGLKENASSRIFVLREGKGGDSSALPIDLKDLLINGNQELNIQLLPNDVVNVPVDQIIKVFVFGEVRTPGALQVKMSENITILQAIAQAGGTTEDAAKTRVIVKRKDPATGKEKEIKVNIKDIIKGKKPDLPLCEGDVVYVPETIF